MKAIRMENESISYREALESEVNQLIYKNEIDVEFDNGLVRYPLIKAYVDDINDALKRKTLATIYKNDLSHRTLRKNT